MKETLQQQLARRKYKIPSRILYGGLYHFVIRAFLEKKYNPTYNIKDNINDCKGPAFVVYNHQSRIDYVWLIRSTYPRRMNFVVGYNEFFRSHLQFLFKIAHMIPKKNFTTDIAAIRGMNSIIKQGGVVCFSPEGMSTITGHNQPVFLGTGKLFKHYNIPVYVLKMKGAYLTNTKYCLDERKGRIDTEFSLLFSPEDIKNMSAEEIESKLNEALWQDEYEWNKVQRISYASNGRICTELHHLCYRCPKCGKEMVMFAEKDYIKCENCGNGAHMNEMYDFIPFDETCVIPESIGQWVDSEREVVYNQIQDPNFELREKVKLGKLPEYKFVEKKQTSEICGEGEVIINHEGFFYKGSKDDKPFEFKLTFEQLPTLGMPTDTSYFALYVDDKYYDLIPFNRATYKILLTVEEMHRLHVNAWKNLPWLDGYRKKENVCEQR